MHCNNKGCSSNKVRPVTVPVQVAMKPRDAIETDRRILAKASNTAEDISNNDKLIDAICIIKSISILVLYQNCCA